MQRALEVFDKKTETLVNSFATRLDEKPPPSIIFHYTNDTLELIIAEENAELRIPSSKSF
jgi:hypothetical protein